MPSNGTAIAAGLIGAGLLWSALYNKSLLSTAKSVVQGKKPQAGPEAITPGAAVAGALSGGAGIPGVTVGIPAGIAAGGSAGNQALGQSLAAGYGWGSGTEWDALVKLWDQESGWNNTAQNPASGAYGIPQALPYTKMPKAAWPPSAGGSASATAQISWGLAYIKGRYGDPVAAWNHEVANDWY
jgi:hypothetical protein